MPLDLTNLGEVAFSWWKDMPWSAACVSVKGAVAMTGVPTATFAALVAEVEAARKTISRVVKAASAVIEGGAWGDPVAPTADGYPRRNVEVHEDKMQALTDALGDLLIPSTEGSAP